MTYSSRKDNSVVLDADIVERHKSHLWTVIMSQHDHTFKSTSLCTMRKLMTIVSEPDQLVPVADCDDMSAV